MSRIESIKQAIMASLKIKKYEKGIEPLFCSPEDSSYQYHRTSSRDEDGRSWYLLEGQEW